MYDLIGDWVAVFLILGIWSFPLYKATKWSRIGALTFTGTMFANQLVISIMTIYSKLYIPLLKGKFFIFIPFLFGILLIISKFSGLTWLSHFAVALMTGVGTGLAIRGGIESNVLAQLFATIKPLVGVSGETSFNNLVTLIFYISVAMYFLFSFVPKTQVSSMSKSFEWIRQIGRYGMMLMFGVKYALHFSLRIGIIMGSLERVLSAFHLI